MRRGCSNNQFCIDWLLLYYDDGSVSLRTQSLVLLRAPLLASRASILSLKTRVVDDGGGDEENGYEDDDDDCPIVKSEGSDEAHGVELLIGKFGRSEERGGKF
ncbi:hypothetical protein PMAYCL1PPCAC_15423, partial [Pristionchus mayeri]